MAVTEESYRWAGELDASMAFASPYASADAAVGAAQFIQECQEHAQGVFANGILVAFWAVEDFDAVVPGGEKVDIFHHGARARNEFQLGQLVHERCVGLDAASNYEALSVGMLGQWGIGFTEVEANVAR